MLHGPRAYTFLQARIAVRPGERLGHWFAWSSWKSKYTRKAGVPRPRG